jgi:phage baseplate assembly protein W
MSTFTVDMTKTARVDFSPLTLADEVGQNIRSILSTALGSSPLSREIGINFDMVDDPYPVAVARLTAEIYAAVGEQEPRAVITEVSFNGTTTDAVTGRIAAVVRFSLSEEVG